MDGQLGERKHIVLTHAIEDYINDACPITSGQVKKKHIKDISTATLRNELNALEAMGYLKQLHTSGGRVPTILGYRYYVNHLLANSNLNLNEDALVEVKNLLDERTKSLSEIVSALAKVVSHAVNYPTVIYMNGYNNLTIESVKIFPLVDGKALTLIQTSSGYITNPINVNASLKSCEDASNFLTKNYSGKTIGEMIETIDKTENEMLFEIENFKCVIDTIIESMRQVLQNKKFDIRTEGSVDLLSQTPETAEQTKKVLKLLDNESELEKALTLDENQDDLSITLVEEEQFSGCALIKAPLCVNGKAVATLGVIGPQRMNYANIASALKVVMNELSKDDKDDNDNKKT